MIRVTRRRVLLAVLALFLVGVGYIAWTLAGLPPVKYYLRYGLDPYCEPTGEKETLEGVEFIEIGPGIFRMGSDDLAESGDWLGRICRPLGLPWGERPEPSVETPVHWVEFRRGFWIATTEITNAQYERFRADHERCPFSRTDDGPVDVFWEDARRYCAWLSRRVGCQVRLPSEAEWECIAQAGKGPWCRKIYMVGNRWPALDDPEVSGVPASRMESMLSNPWGLQGLSDLPAEWCEDEWFPDYVGAPRDGSARTGEGSTARVVRGMRASTGLLRSGLGVSRGWFHIGPCSRSGESVSGPFLIRSIGLRPAFSLDDDADRETLRRYLERSRPGSE